MPSVITHRKDPTLEYFAARKRQYRAKHEGYFLHQNAEEFTEHEEHAWRGTKAQFDTLYAIWRRHKGIELELVHSPLPDRRLSTGQSSSMGVAD